MSARRRAIALSAALAGSLLVPLATAPPARAAACLAPGASLTTSDPLYDPAIHPNVQTTFSTSYLTWQFACVAQGILVGNCRVATFHDGTRAFLQPDETYGQSCLWGARRFLIVAVST